MTFNFRTENNIELSPSPTTFETFQTKKKGLLRIKNVDGTTDGSNFKIYGKIKNLKITFWHVKEIKKLTLS